MISVDRDALLCDIAETYGLYDLAAVPVSVLATLAAGLRDDSRIKMKMRGEQLTKTEMMLAAAIDRLSVLVWLQTEDARNGINYPKSVLDKMLGIEKEDSGVIQSFNSPVEFEQAWAEITGVRHGN